MRYRVTDATHLETYHDTYGAIDLEFPAGEVEPRSEQEEAALQALVASGLATTVDTPPAAVPDPTPTHPEAVTDAAQ